MINRPWRVSKGGHGGQGIRVPRSFAMGTSRPVRSGFRKTRHQGNANVHLQRFRTTRLAQLASAIRALAMDAVQEPNSGHPGMPMGMAEIAEVLWNRHLRHNPANPAWPDRDRFVLSNGHGSMLLYALLHLTGYDLPIDELKRFRQLHSKTPGHPELGCTPGVETTTGPLGQGLANAVGMAIAEKLLARGVQPARARDRRPPHLCVPRRRLPDGGHLARGLLAGRHARAGQADRRLRRQRHLDRRPRRAAGSPTTRRSASRPTAGT